jgi:protein-tyrosine phosphatase
MYYILFVCMGNICRSPTAEGFFRHHLQQSALCGRIGVDSAGTHGYHLGNRPDERAIGAAAGFGVDLADLRARRITAGDFETFDRIIAMDRDNLADLGRLAPAGRHARFGLMMDYASGAGPAEVPDPYYGSLRDFAYMCELLDRATRGLLRRREAERA